MQEIKRLFGFFEPRERPTPMQYNFEVSQLYRGFPSIDPKVATVVIGEKSGTKVALGINVETLEEFGISPNLVDIALQDLKRRLAPRERRKRSEPLERLLEKLDDLLPRSQLTATGRRVGREEFRLDFENGIDKSNPAGWRSSWLADEDPKSGGIFDGRRVKELEFKGFLRYANSFQQLLLLQLLIEEGEFPNISHDAKTEIDRKVRETEDTLDQWGKECKAKFHQDPADFILTPPVVD